MKQSSIPLGSVLIALAVLVMAALVVRAAYVQGARRGARPTVTDEPELLTVPAAAPAVPLGPVAARAPADGTVSFLVTLGEAMLDAGDPVTHVGVSLNRVARASGLPTAEIVVLPTALIVSVPGETTVQTAVTSAGRRRLRLDQIDAVFRVVHDAERGAIEPREGLARLRDARGLPLPFGPGARVVGYTVLTLGLALLLRGSWLDLVVAGVLGAGVGALLLLAVRVPTTYQLVLPVVCAFAVSLAVFLLARRGLDLSLSAPLVAPLVTFLPGALLTTSVIELATGEMISGAGRLAAGAMQLVLLALGIVAAAQLVGIPAADVGQAAAQPLGAVAPWLGVAVFGVGVLVHQSGRRSSLGWILLVLYVAYAGQVLGGLFFGGVLSAFFGALLMTPVAMFVATQRTGPPTLVSFLPAFWLLVPGALGLVGVTTFLGQDRVDGVAAMVAAGATMVAIAMGVLLGLAAGTGLAVLLERVARRRTGPPAGTRTGLS